MIHRICKNCLVQPICKKACHLVERQNRVDKSKLIVGMLTILLIFFNFSAYAASKISLLYVFMAHFIIFLFLHYMGKGDDETIIQSILDDFREINGISFTLVLLIFSPGILVIVFIGGSWKKFKGTDLMDLL